MLISTEYFVYLWMLPVTIFIILPVLLLVGWTIVKGIMYLAAKPKPLAKEIAESLSYDGLHPSEA